MYKEQALIKFYKECEKNNYTDMTDATQSLKAKVIATDLGLNYGSSIKKLYEKAKALSEKETRDNLEREKKRQEAIAHKSIDGIPLFKVITDDTQIIVYRRPDESKYYTIGPQIENKGAWSGRREADMLFTYKEVPIVTYQHNPAQMVFTSATVGGVTTGGISTTKESTSSQIQRTGRGIIHFICDSKDYRVSSIQLFESVRDAFKRDSTYKSLVDSNGVIACRREADRIMAEAALRTADPYLRTSMMSTAENESYLTLTTCFSITGFMDRILRGSYPESDENIYDRAKRLSDSQGLDALKEAKKLFEKISDYKDSEEWSRSLAVKIAPLEQEYKEKLVLSKDAKRKKTKLLIIIGVPVLVLAVVFFSFVLPMMKKNKMRNYEQAKIGDIILFGNYEQDNNAANGKEEIEWIVLDKYDTALLVVSKKGLDSQTYNSEYTEITWEECTLRQWLNNEFYRTAFNGEEQSKIQQVLISEAGATDKIFLLSYGEAEKYFPTDNLRQCKPTKYAVNNGAKTYDNGASYWWLQGFGYTTLYAASVTDDGSFSDMGSIVHDPKVVVRPAMLIKIE